MAHEISVKLPTAEAPSDAKERYDEFRERFDRVLAADTDDEVDLERPYDTVEYGDDDDREDYDRFRILFDTRENVDEIIDTLVEDYYPVVEWFLVETRTNRREFGFEKYADDTGYYSPDMQKGLRAPVSVSRTALHTLQYGEVSYRLAGSNYDAGGSTVEVEPPQGERRLDLLVATDEGTVEYVDGTGGEHETEPEKPEPPTGTFTLAVVEVHPGKIVSVETAELDTSVDEFGDPHLVRGVVPERHL